MSRQINEEIEEVEKKYLKSWSSYYAKEGKINKRIEIITLKIS